MALLYKPLYTKDSPEFIRALDYLALTSGGALSSPVVHDTIEFAGPEGSYEDIQVEFAVPQGRATDKPSFQSSIDLLTQYPNVVLIALSAPQEGYQWFTLSTPLNPFAPVLKQLAIVTPPTEPASDGNLWLGPKQTRVGLPDVVGDRRYSAPTDGAAIGALTVLHGFKWQKIEYVSLFTAGKQVWWQAVAVA